MLAFSASVARVWVPSTGLWLRLAGLTAAGFFLLGYLSPAPNDHDEDLLDDDLDDDEDLDDDVEPDTVSAGDATRAAADRPGR